MVIDMSEQKLVTLLQLRQFLDGTQEVEFRGCGKDQDPGDRTIARNKCIWTRTLERCGRHLWTMAC